jgi:hypothetical protein
MIASFWKSNKCILLMLSSWLAMFSCKKDNIPIFPQTNNTEIKIEQLAIPANQNVVSYIISQDKKQLYVYTFENENDHTHFPMVGSHLLVFDQNGKMQNDVPLNINANGAYYELFFTNQGSLTMLNLDYLQMIDTQNFGLKSIRSFTPILYHYYKFFFKNITWRFT